MSRSNLNLHTREMKINSRASVRRLKCRARASVHSMTTTGTRTANGVGQVDDMNNEEPAVMI